MSSKVGKQGNSIYFFKQKNINWKYVSKNAYSDTVSVFTPFPTQNKSVKTVISQTSKILDIKFEKFFSEDSLEFKQILYTLTFVLNDFNSGKVIKYKQIFPEEDLEHKIDKEISKTLNFYSFIKDKKHLTISDMIQEKETFLFYYYHQPFNTVNKIKFSPMSVFKDNCKIPQDGESKTLKDISLKAVSFIKTLKPFGDSVLVPFLFFKNENSITREAKHLYCSQFKRIGVYNESFEVKYTKIQNVSESIRNALLISTSFIQN